MEDAPERLATEAESYAWEVRLWRQSPSKLSGIFAAAVIAGAFGYLLFHSVALTMIGFLVVVGSTTEFWLPQKLKLDRNSASLRCGISVTSIQWRDVKRVIEDGAGVRLTPLSEDNRLSPFRGVYLRFANNRDEVMSWIERLRG